MLDWRNLFAFGESPYFAMYRCGLNGIPLDDVLDHLRQLNIPVREKDIRNYNDGSFKRSFVRPQSNFNPTIKKPTAAQQVMQSKLSDLKKLPDGWKGTDKRWFPCSWDNKPMMKWGYSKDYIPSLYTRDAAIALSDCGYVGQNMYAQPFIVIDIDGEGHGTFDERTIAWGEKYRNITECWSHPSKPGSFHLYFSTPHIVPISHFPYAHIDLMGNQTNAAVYTKVKQSNGINRLMLTDDIWNDLKTYVNMRKEERNK